MKITIKGPNLHNILVQMRGLIEAAKLENISGDVSEKTKSSAVPSESYEFKSVGAQGPGPQPLGDPFNEEFAVVDKPVAKSVDKPAKTVNPQIAKMQAAKAAKKAEREAAAAAPPPVEKPKAAVPKAVTLAEQMDPAEMVKIRQKTIADLQDAYANGHQAEVFELLSRFGNGAKSFRELPPDAFVPISEAIAKGALT
jgi:hypothetical protein